ncbi:unnamed protein product, partial [marine sediment metagenome]
ISVAATNSNDKKAPFSNYSAWVDIAAPGVDVLSLRATGTSMGTIYDSYTTIASGTSMSCPHVVGVLGLLLSHYPDVSFEEITARLLENADDISQENPYYEGLLGSGRVNAFKAVRESFEGRITLDNDWYSCSDVVHIEVLDFDLIGQVTQNVTITTDGNDLETVTLIEDVNEPWVFTGTILTLDGPVITGDDTLQVLHGQIITAIYDDADDGTGNPATVEATATADCQPPAIFSVEVVDITSTGAWVAFRTGEQTTGRVRCGLACGGPYTIIA